MMRKATKFDPEAWPSMDKTKGPSPFATSLQPAEKKDWKGGTVLLFDTNTHYNDRPLSLYVRLPNGVVHKAVHLDRQPSNADIHRAIIFLQQHEDSRRNLWRDKTTLKKALCELPPEPSFIKGIADPSFGVFGAYLDERLTNALFHLDLAGRDVVESESAGILGAFKKEPSAITTIRKRMKPPEVDFKCAMVVEDGDSYRIVCGIYALTYLGALKAGLERWQKELPLEDLYLPEGIGGPIPTEASSQAFSTSGLGRKRKKGNRAKKADAQLPPIRWEHIQVNPDDWLRTVDNPTPDSVCLLDGPIPARGKGLLPFDDPFAKHPKAPRLGKRPVHDLDHLPFLAAQILRVHPYVFEYYQRCASPARWACGEVDKGVCPPPKELAARGHTKEDYALRQDNFHFTFFDATLAEEEDAVTVLRAVEVHRIARVYRDAEHRDQARDREDPHGKPVFYCVHPSWEANIRDQWELGKRHMEQGRHIDNAAISRYLAARKHDAIENAES